MKKLAAIMVLAVFALMIFGGSALAWSPRTDGRPDAYQPGDSRGFFIWHDGNGLHVRTTTYGREHEFSGVIRTDGRFADVDGVKLEGNDFYNAGDGRHMLTFRFHTDEGVDGVDFKIAGGDRVNFDLFIDGHHINPAEIYIGNRDWHPQAADFILHR